MSAHELVVGRQGQELVEGLGRGHALEQARAPRRSGRRRSARARASSRSFCELLVQRCAPKRSAVTGWPSLERARRGAATARPACARSPRWPRPPSGCRAARSRCPAARPRGTGRRRGCCGAARPRCACPRARGSRSARPTLHVLALARRSGSAPGMCASKISMASGTRPGWATQVPSWPSCTSRSLSARTLARAASFAARVVLDRDLRRHAAHRVDAAPVAGLDEELRVGPHEGLRHRHLRRGRAAPSAGSARSFLMKLKM